MATWPIPDSLKAEVRRVLGYPDLLSAASIQTGYPGFSSQYTIFQPYAVLEDKLIYLTSAPAEAVPIFGAEHALFASFYSSASFAFTLASPSSPAVGATVKVTIAGAAAVTVTAVAGDSPTSMAGKVATALASNASVIPTASGAAVTLYALTAGKSGNGTSVSVIATDPSLTVSPTGPIATGVTAGGMDPPGPYYTDSTLGLTTFGYLPIIRILESALANASDNLDSTKADSFVWRPSELAERTALLRRFRRELADRLGVPLDPDIVGNRRRGSVRVV